MKRKLPARMLCLILCLSMLLAPAAAAARDTSFEEDLAMRLKGLGLFRGVSDTEFDLERAPTRLEALVMLIRLLGKEEAALSGNWRHPFTDVPRWADPYVGYAYERELTNGVSDTEFGMSSANAAVYLTFVLRALGYSDTNGQDFTWKDPYSLASQTGILPECVDTWEFWRADAVTVSYAAILARLKDSSLTLGEKLISAGAFSEAQFEQYYDRTLLLPEKQRQEFSFIKAAEYADSLIPEAVAQYEAEDYTALAEPVRYNVLWLGYTHVFYDELDFRMTDFDRDYLRAVALNFEKSVECITGHNLDISVDLYFIEDPAPLKKISYDEWLYLAQETVQAEIDRFAAVKDYDSVLTTVQTAGKDNYARNQGKAGYGIHYVMLGVETAGLESPMGYSAFDLTEPKAGTYPLEDPEVPSLYATAVAVHEWMHQLEYLGTMLGIEYPSTHAYMGPTEFPGYLKYTADENDYDFFEFYKLVLQGKLPYTKDGVTKHVGMYPKMWRLTKRNALDLGAFDIVAADGAGYLSGQREEPRLFLSDAPFKWHIRHAGEGRFIISPESIPEWRMDLNNAWDSEDNTVGLWYDTGYIDAQTWILTENEDGSYYIQTPYESGRVVTVPGLGESAVIRSIGSSGTQLWKILPD